MATTASAAAAEHDRLHLAGDPAGNAILAENPFALLVGMQLDQQIPMEKAFSGPAVLRERLRGGVTAAPGAGAAPVGAMAKGAAMLSPARNARARSVSSRRIACAPMRSARSAI